MLQNAYLLAKIGADTAENDRKFAENLPKIGNYTTGPLPARGGQGRRGGARAGGGRAGRGGRGRRAARQGGGEGGGQGGGQGGGRPGGPVG